MNKNDAPKNKSHLLGLPFRADVCLMLCMIGIVIFALVVTLLLFPGDKQETDSKVQQHESSTLPESARFGVQYLMEQQSDDGRWRSTYYGNLKQGAAMTAFVLYSLPPGSLDDKAKLQLAVDALLPEIEKNGFVTNPDGPDYTNYGSSMLLVACLQHELNLPEAARQKLIDYLVRSQLDAEEGYDESRVNFGGWDLSGWMTGTRPTTGTNTSVTASVVEALSHFADEENVGQALENTEAWLKRVQNTANEAGGFYFHPKREHDGNKAGWSDGDDRKKTRSYGSATADGLRIMSALGKPADDPSVVATINWLQENNRLEKVPGFEHEPDGEASWSNGLRYYYYQSLSRSLDKLPTEDAKRIAASILRTLIKEQKSDGSWSNPNARMREDDPIIATGFAVIALYHCQKFMDKF